MQKFSLTFLALLLSGPALAQGGMGGGPPGGGPPGGGAGGPPGMRRMPAPPKPIKRGQIDKIVTEIFQTADGNRDGIVTIDELRAVIAQRRDAVIRKRFAAIDTNRNASVELAEFITWQMSMGSLADSDTQAGARDLALIPETITPEIRDRDNAHMLGLLIEPLNSVTIANANSNYDNGVSLTELLTYQRKRFDAADKDGDGELSAFEQRGLEPERGRPGLGRRPGGADGPLPFPSGRDMPDCPPDSGAC
jgi:hypothetical protein